MPLQVDLTQISPYYDTLGDGVMQLSFSLPLPAGTLAEQAVQVMLERMNMTDIRIVESRPLSAEITFFVVYARTLASVNAGFLSVHAEAAPPEPLRDLLARVKDALRRRIVVIGATLESDAHTVGLDAIFSPKGYAGDYGLEHYPAFRTVNLGAQVPFQTLLDTIRREAADVVLISQTITQKGLHLKNLTHLADLLEAEGLRDQLVLAVGGSNITPQLAKELGFDAGFGRGTLPSQVVRFVANAILEKHHA